MTSDGFTIFEVSYELQGVRAQEFYFHCMAGLVLLPVTRVCCIQLVVLWHFRLSPTVIEETDALCLCTHLTCLPE